MCATRATMSHGSRRRTSRFESFRTIASLAVRPTIEAVDLAAATARGTSDACIVASLLAPWRHDHQPLRPAQDAELSILSRAARHLHLVTAHQRPPTSTSPIAPTELRIDRLDYVADTWPAASGDNRLRELIDPYNRLEMSRPASSSLVAQTRFAAAGQIGTIELFCGGHAGAAFPFVSARAT